MPIHHAQPIRALSAPGCQACASIYSVFSTVPCSLSGPWQPSFVRHAPAAGLCVVQSHAAYPGPVSPKWSGMHRAVSRALRSPMQTNLVLCHHAQPTLALSALRMSGMRQHMDHVLPKHHAQPIRALSARNGQAGSCQASIWVVSCADPCRQGDQARLASTSFTWQPTPGQECPTRDSSACKRQAVACAPPLG